MYSSNPPYCLIRSLQYRNFPTVTTLSVRGHPRGYAWCGGFPWVSPPGPDHLFCGLSRLLSYIFLLILHIVLLVSVIPGALFRGQALLFLRAGLYLPSGYIPVIAQNRYADKVPHLFFATIIQKTSIKLFVI